MNRLLPLAVLSACLALVGCATTGRLAMADKLQLYREHAGSAQPNLQYFGSLNGWTDLGDSALAVWTRPGEAYLLELSGTCPDLSSSVAIGLTSSMGRVSVPFDKVIVRGTGGLPTVPCPIRSIRKLDVKALKADEKALRQAQVQERE